MDDNFRFAQHVADAAYAYEIESGMGKTSAAKTYHQVFNAIYHYAEIDLALADIGAIYGLAEDAFVAERADRACLRLDKVLGLGGLAELRTPHPRQAEIDRESAATLRAPSASREASQATSLQGKYTLDA
jgi:hypothetical protein